MTDQRQLHHLLDVFFEQGTDELADRVLESALVQIDHTQQRRRSPAPWRFPSMTIQSRLAAAAVIGVLAIGGALFVLRPNQTVGPSNTTPAPTPAASASGATPTAALGSWIVTGSPSVDRGTNSITVGLIDGRVLVAGGGSEALDSAELYDPATGTWSPTAAMHDARTYAVAVRLTDGRVLVAGGDDGTNNLASAEIFDPRTGAWTVTGDMNVARNQAFGALLADGRVLVAGAGTDQGLKTSAEIFDPAKGTWTPTGSLITGRAGPLAATLLDDGRVLVIGGFNADQRSAEIYDPETHGWSSAGTLAGQRVDEQTTQVDAQGLVLSIGGTPTGAEVFDPATKTWRQTSAMVQRYADRVTSVLLPSNLVLVVGGGRSGGQLAGSQLFEAPSQTWIEGPTLVHTTYVRAALMLPNGGVLVIGSTTSGAGGTPTAELYSPDGS